MPDAHSLLLFLAAGLALNFTPGPDMLYVAARGASEGRAAGIVSALGIGAGTLVHITLVALGLAALLAAVPVAYTLVRIAGAIYLIYLGVRALRSKSTLSVERLQPASLGAIFRQGVITNVLNPKVALFFLAFLPQFVDPARGSVSLQVVVLGALFVGIGLCSDSTYALLASRFGTWLRTSRSFRHGQRYVAGGIYVGLGVTAALAGAKTTSASS